jgi:hypothetical protein
VAGRGVTNGNRRFLMKRMFTAALTLAALAATPATQALGVTPKQAAKIAKRVFDREIQQWEASRVMPAQITTPVDHAATADHATTAAHATTAGHSTNASHAVNAGRAITAGHATTADRAANVDYAATAGSVTSAETAEVAGVAENANPMAYAYITNDGHIDGPRSSRDIRYNGGGSSGDYCFSAPRPKGIQVTADCTWGCGFRSAAR